MIRGHGGNIDEMARRLKCRPEAIVDMSSNVNPYGPPADLVAHLKAQLFRIGTLPEVDARSAVERFAAHHGLLVDEVAIGSGTTQLIYDLPRALETRRALILGPTYADYKDGCQRQQAASAFCMARETNGFRPDLNEIRAALADVDTVYVCNPNNPTGALLEGEILMSLCREFPDKHFVVDESYLPFVAHPEKTSLIGRRPPNALVLHSMSKIFRIPGLRIGFAVGGVEIIRRLKNGALPWNVNSLALEALHYLLDAGEAMTHFVQETRDRLALAQTAMSDRLARIPGLRMFPSATGFFLVRLPAPHRSETIYRQLAEKRILVRDCANFDGLSDRFIRISLQDNETNLQCAETLERILTG